MMRVSKKLGEYALFLDLLCGASLIGLATPAQGQAVPSDFTTGYRYDAMRRLTGTISPDPDGAGPLHYLAVRNTYDVAGRLAIVETGELAQWQSETLTPANWSGFTVLHRWDAAFDAMDRKMGEGVRAGASAPYASMTNYAYDSSGRVQCTAARMNAASFALVQDACAVGPEGSQGPDRITRNFYDDAGQLQKVQKAYGTGFVRDYVTYQYTPNGKVKLVTDANGNPASMTYDGFDRQLQWNFPSATSAGTVSSTDREAYTYDPNGNRLTLTKRDGSVIGYAYDALNRLIQKTVPASASGAAGYTIYTGYDLRGLETYARFGSASGPGIVTVYDAIGRVTSSTTTMDGTARVLSSGYDADGNRTALSGDAGYSAGFTYDGLDRMSAYQGVATFTYDAAGRRAGLDMGPGYSTSSTSWHYDDVGQLQTQAHGLGGSSSQSVTFGYNPASQIVSEARTNDAYASNRAYNVSRGYTVNSLNQYTAAGPAGAQAPFVYDLNGNLTDTLAVDGSTIHYRYDAENRLVQATIGGGTVTLSYDPDGRLWQVAGPSSLSRFLYDGDQLVQEYDASGTPNNTYVHGPGEDEPLTWYSSAGRRHLHANHQGSIIAIADDNGNAVAINAYDTWGVPNTTNMGRFGYTGQAWLPELGMWYYKARIYSPTLGRFLQTDPVGYKGGLNLYAYAENDPADKVDSNGQWPKKIHERIIDAAFPRLSPAARATLKKQSAAVDSIFPGQLNFNSYQHAMRGPGESEQEAKQKARAFVRQHEDAAKRIQGTTPQRLSDIKPESLVQFGTALHTVSDFTSPAHTDENGNPMLWNMNDITGVAFHSLGEESITAAQMSNAVSRERVVFGLVYGARALCLAAGTCR